MTWIIHKTCIEMEMTLVFLDTILRGSHFLTLWSMCTEKCQWKLLRAHFFLSSSPMWQDDMQSNAILAKQKRRRLYAKKLVAHFLHSWIGKKLYKIHRIFIHSAKTRIAKMLWLCVVVIHAGCHSNKWLIDLHWQPRATKTFCQLATNTWVQ